MGIVMIFTFLNYFWLESVGFTILPILSLPPDQTNLLAILLTITALTVVSVTLIAFKRIINQEENKLKKTLSDREMLASIVKSAHDAIVSTSLTLKIETWNKGAELLFGYPFDQVYGRHFSDFVGTNVVSPQNLKNHTTFELSIKTRQSERKVCAVTVEYRIDYAEKVQGLVFMLRDITIQKKIELELQEAFKQKEEFTSLVSHELRTPLSIIKQSIAILDEELSTKLNPELRDFLNTATHNIDRLYRLVNNFLDFQRLKENRFKIDKSVNDIGALLKETRSQMELLANKRGLALAITHDGSIPPFSFDKDKIMQVLVNLINNAIKFMEKGVIHVETRREGNFVYVHVHDQGIGIEEKDIPLLFRAYGRLPTRASGTGLGLLISKKIVELHGGSLAVKSKVGTGSTFSFRLPLEEIGG